MLPHCCPNRELREWMAAMIFKGNCVYEVSFRVCEQGTVSVYTCRVYNFIASHIMDYKLLIVGQGWKYIVLLIGFVHLHRVICLIHVYVQHTQLGKERL